MKTLICAACLLLFSSCGSMSAEPNLPINTVCPMNPEKVVTAESASVDYEGAKVAFCCKRCARKFESLTAEEKAALVAGTARR